MVSKVSNKVSCVVRIPASRLATAVHLLAEEQVSTWWCCKKMTFAPIMCIQLDHKRRRRISYTHYEYPDCRVHLNVDKILELDTNSYVKLKVKRGNKTIQKQIVDAKFLIECIQESDMFADIHVAVDVYSYYTLTAGLNIWTKLTLPPENKSTVAEVEAAAANETRMPVVEATRDLSLSNTIPDQPVQDVSETITDQPLEPVPVACRDDLIMDDGETDDEWEHLPSSGDDENPNISSSEGVLMNEEQTTHNTVEAAPLWVTTVCRVVKVTVLGLLAVTVVGLLGIYYMVVVGALLPGLGDDEV